VLERGEYDAEGAACISLTRFREILHVYLLDVYGEGWNRGVGGVPAQRWAAAEASGWTPALHHDAEEVRILLGRGATRTIQRAGIDHLCLRYQSTELDDLRRALPASTPVAVKYDPENLGSLHVQTQGGNSAWLHVPAVDQAYAEGLSVWKHRVIRSYVRRTMNGAVDVEALASAKARIQDIVEQEFRHTRKGRRMRAARFLNVGVDKRTSRPTPSTPVVVATTSVSPSQSDHAAPDPSREAGWGADYGLPREIRRDPQR